MLLSELTNFFKAEGVEDLKLPLGRPILVTSGLPYANGYAHIGHLRTYVPADFFVRYLRKLGEEVVYVCGSDVHGTPIVIKAEEEGVSPKELVEKYHKHFQEIFRMMNIEFDNYGRTDSEFNVRRTQEIVGKLMENGYVYPKEIELAYCPVCDRFLPDRYVEGECPYCGAIARGDECDQGCGKHLEPGEILNPRCKICGSEAEYRKQEHYFLKLTAFESFLREYLEKLDGTENAINYAREWVESGLKDWCITRNLEWGIKFPGRDDLVVYVWVDAPIGYISSTEEWSVKNNDSWEKFWLDGRGFIIHFIGTDIVYHHCILWPSMLKGSGYNLPSAVVASGMVKIEDKTFSKSRGYVVWVKEDYLDRGFHPDLLRYYLLSYTSHTKELNFSWRVFQQKVNSELVGALGNLIYRVLLFAKRNFDGEISGEISEEVIRRIEDTRDAVIRNLQTFEFKRVVDEIMALADFGNTYFQKNEPWKVIKEDRELCRRIIMDSLQIIKAICILMHPVMPGLMKEVWRQLGEESDLDKVTLDEIAKPVKGRIGDIHPVFRKIEDEEIREAEEILERRIKKAEGRGDEEMITIEEFKKLDIRVGTVVQAERIEGSNKLLKLLVDIGEERPRQIVAGIAKTHKPEELVGKQVVVLANLKPAKLMEVTSEGMILAAGETPVLLTVEKEVENGAKVS